VVYSNLQQINIINSNEGYEITNKVSVNSTHLYPFQEENHTDAMQIMYVQDICIAAGFDHSLANPAYETIDKVCVNAIKASFVLNKRFCQCQPRSKPLHFGTPPDSFATRATFILQQLEAMFTLRRFVYLTFTVTRYKQYGNIGIRIQGKTLCLISGYERVCLEFIEDMASDIIKT
jgi:hypothetical protein